MFGQHVVGRLVPFGGPMTGPTLIGLAHGSRHPGVAAGISSLLAAVTAEIGVATRAAFLDLTVPDPDQVTAELAAAGERTAVVVPLLFTDAFHARTDVPAAVQHAAQSAGMDLALAPILGTGDDLLDVLAARLTISGARPDEPILLYAVGSSRASANAAVADLAVRLAERRSNHVRVGFGTCEPRAADVLADLVSAMEPPGTVLPLFVAPGLLLDAVAPAARAAGWRLADPLGDLLAAVVAHRYLATVAGR